MGLSAAGLLLFALVLSKTGSDPGTCVYREAGFLGASGLAAALMFRLRHGGWLRAAGFVVVLLIVALLQWFVITHFVWAYQSWPELCLCEC